MVKVREEHPENDDGSVNIERWVARLPVDLELNTQVLQQACELSYRVELKALATSDKTRNELTSSFRIGLEMAITVLIAAIRITPAIIWLISSPNCC